jgi:hypothetical protein
MDNSGKQLHGDGGRRVQIVPGKNKDRTMPAGLGFCA